MVHAPSRRSPFSHSMTYTVDLIGQTTNKMANPYPNASRPKCRTPPPKPSPLSSDSNQKEGRGKDVCGSATVWVCKCRFALLTTFVPRRSDQVSRAARSPRMLRPCSSAQGSSVKELHSVLLPGAFQQSQLACGRRPTAPHHILRRQTMRAVPSPK